MTSQSTLTPVIAVDGPAASGKTTLARKLAARLGFDHLNTGLLYRAVGHKVFARGHTEQDVAVAVEMAATLSATDLADSILTSPAVGQQASRIAGLMPVREALLAYQRGFCACPPGGRGAILDGRDIGSFIWPQANAKIFVTASEDERARRREAEIIRDAANCEQNSTIPLQSGPAPVTRDAVLADLAARDARDAANSPYNLVVVPGAYLLDTSLLDIAATLAAALAFVTPRL